jgi:hypothetical protein
MSESADPIAPPPASPARKPLPRWALLALAGLVFAGFVFLLILAVWPGDSAEDELQATYDRLLDEAKRMVEEGTLARADGYIYAVDINQLATFAALAGQRELYDPLRAIILSELLIDDKDEDYTRGFVAWRYKARDDAGNPVPRDASGSTEALRAAEALWRGSEAFDDRRDDRDTALRILQGYARHATTETHRGQDIWFIRNYYNLQTKAWATNSFLIDYDPDFVAFAAEQSGDEVLAEVARQSEALFKKAVAPTGLLREMVQPEVLTLMGIEHAIFAPNNLEQLSNSAAEAERSVATNKPLAVGVLRFALQHADNLRLNYNVETGEPRGPGVGAETYAPLLRLAHKLDDRDAVETFLPKLLHHTERFLDDPNARDRLYLLGEALLALELVMEQRS